MNKQKQRSERSLYTDKSDTSEYKADNQRIHIPIFNNTSPYQMALAMNPLKGLNARPYAAQITKPLVKAGKREIGSKSLEISAGKEEESKKVKPSNRYQPKGIVKKAATKREYKSIEHPFSSKEIPQIKKKSLNKNQMNQMNQMNLFIQEQPLYVPPKNPNLSLHPQIQQSLSAKSKLQKSYIILYSAYQQAISRLMTSDFSINLMDKLEDMRRCCDRYANKVIRNDKTDQNLFQSSEENIKQYFKNYKTLWREFSLEKLNNQASVSFKKYKNSVYFGNFKDGKKEGMGIMIYQNGKLFEGSFENDMRTHGMEKDAGYLYLGRFVNGVKQGPNGFYTDDQIIQYGRFALDQWVGQGFRLTNSEIVCAEDVLSIVKNNYNNVFVGKYIDGVKSQICLERFPDGDIYLGTYEDNKPQGYGQYYWANGAVYQGDFVYGLRHGSGYWFMQGGDEYVGQYSNDKKCGKGEYTWTNGTKYIGMFENDFRHGYGEIFWNNGKCYKGNWVNGIEATKKISVSNNEPERQPSSRSNSKLPQLKAKQQIFRNKVKVDNNFDVKKAETIDVVRNRGSRQISQRVIRKDRIKALFNPNFYLEN